jgi:hypothetical protein
MFCFLLPAMAILSSTLVLLLLRWAKVLRVSYLGQSPFMLARLQLTFTTQGK